MADLADAGYVVKLKDGRRNRYRVQADLPLPDPIGRQRTIGELLDILVDTPTGRPGPTRRHLNERSVMAPTPSLLDATAVRHTDRPPPRRTARPSRGLAYADAAGLMFAGDPTLHPTALPDWWLCAPCRAALLGGPRPIPSADMQPITVPGPVHARTDQTTSVPVLPGCWYRDPAHRPRLGWCPSTCHDPITHAERLGHGDQHIYCETQAHWRRQTIRQPTLVRG